MPARLTIHFSDQPARSVYLPEVDSYLIGRDPSCEIVLDDARVSRRHARLTLGDGGGRIADLGSKNGIAVDGRSVDEAPLADACWVSIGGLLLLFEHGPEVAASRGEDRQRREATLGGHRRLAEAGLEVRELVARLLASFVEMSGTDRGFLLLAREGGRFEVVASRGHEAETVRDRRFSGSASTVEEVLTTGAPQVRSDASACALSGAKPSVIAGGIRALACVPLIAAGRTLGAVYADSRRPGKGFDELDLEILTALASHAALAMWAAGLREELEGLSRGLPTRLDRRTTGILALPGFPAWPITADETLPREPA